MGVIDAENKKYSDKPLLVSLRSNILINLFLRYGICEHKEEIFIQLMLNLYRNAHRCCDIDKCTDECCTDENFNYGEALNELDQDYLDNNKVADQ